MFLFIIIIIYTTLPVKASQLGWYYDIPTQMFFSKRKLFSTPTPACRRLSAADVFSLTSRRSSTHSLRWLSSPSLLTLRCCFADVVFCGYRQIIWQEVQCPKSHEFDSSLRSVSNLTLSLCSKKFALLSFFISKCPSLTNLHSCLIN